MNSVYYTETIWSGSPLFNCACGRWSEVRSPSNTDHKTSGSTPAIIHCGCIYELVRRIFDLGHGSACSVTRVSFTDGVELAHNAPASVGARALTFDH